ncbi:histidine kinase [Vallitalea longa]|uniref:Histidine kinase n=1 Tax=Vallitalea longa TaxID=2936439 RepID=A0A9W5YCA0_9FIRM|nr:histidine kinase [Vallitalea longa]GKX29693.1 histidine kinase [Vallitalea longa]
MCKFKKSIFMQLILLIILVILVPLLFLGYTTYSSYQRDTETKIISSNLAALQQLDQTLKRVTDQVNSIINTYNNNKLFEMYLTQQYSSDYNKIKTTKIVEDILVEHISSLNWINCEIILIGKNNNIFTSNDNPPKLSATSVYNSYWYQNNLLHKDMINWHVLNRSYFSKDSTSTVLAGTKTLNNYISDNIYGTIIIELNEKYFYNIYKKILDKGEILMIQNSDGNIISSSDRTITPSLDPEDTAYPIQSESLVNNYKYHGKKYLYISQPSSISDWVITKLIPSENMNEEFNKLQKNFIYIYIACIMLVSIGIFITALRIYYPIQKLSNKLQRQFMSSDNERDNNHFSLINIMTGYEQLINDVDITIDQLMEENEARRKAELHALAMQINPHFLYNTLNSIKCLVWTNQYKLIEPTINCLVNLLRQTLHSMDKLITLEEEIKNIKNYVFIQNIRTDNLISINYDIPLSYYNNLIPSLILQPIVENSIFHGIEPLGKQGCITISAYHEGKDLYIEVLDNGVGMSEKTLTNILEQTKVSNNKSSFNHIGINNINNRIKLYYGTDYGVHYESKENLGTSVTLKVKYSC